MADVTITYQGNTIAEISDSTQKALKTRGKFLTSDIGITYEKPSGGGVTPFILNTLTLQGSMRSVISNGAIIADTPSVNLWDGITGTVGYIVLADGTVTANADGVTSPSITPQGGIYVWRGTGGYSSEFNHRVHAYDAGGNWLYQITYKGVNQNQAFEIQFGVSDPQVASIKLSSCKDDTNVSLICYS